MSAPVGFLLNIEINAEVHGSADDTISLSVSSPRTGKARPVGASSPRGVIGPDDFIEDVADAAAASLKSMILRVYHRAQEVAALEQELGEIHRGQKE